MPANDRDREPHDAKWFEQTYGCTPREALDWLLPYALRLSHCNRCAAEDLAQSTIEHLLKKTLKTVPSNPRAYIMRIQTNKFLDERRRNSTIRRGGGTSTLPLEEAPEQTESTLGPELLFLTRATREMLLDAIQKLPEHEREVVELALDVVQMGLDFRPPKEIAKIMGIPEGTVKRRLHDAKRHLRKLMPPQWKGGTND